MKIKFVIALAILALSASAYAGTVYMPSVSSLAPGWNMSVVADSSGRGSITNKATAGSNGFQFTLGDKDKTSGVRSILGTTSYDGVALSSITTLKARVMVIEGDGNYQAPKFVLKLQKAIDNVSDRTLEWIPFSDGVTRVVNTWFDLDATVDGSWICPNTGATYLTLAAAQAAIPGGLITSSSTYWPLLPYGFSIGSNNWVSNVSTYNDNSRGVCDWFEVGINGVNTKYDLYDVPEPGALLALATGLIGFVGLRRRVK
jgi:hypothetical protein